MMHKPRVGLIGNPDSPWRLVGDIGGTNARFALVDDYGALQRQQTLRCENFAGPAEAMRHYLSAREVASVRAAAVAVATPVYDDDITFTNRASWAFSIRDLGHQLGVKSFHVINDFNALALAVPRLDPEYLPALGLRGGIERHAPKAVIGPGTGLGVSGVFFANRHWHALDSEGGHVTMSPGNDRESELLSLLRRRFDHVSAERVLSGPGLENLYQVSCELEARPVNTMQASDITQQALTEQDDICSRVVDDFCAMLGTATGNLVLTLGARGGAYLGGGIAPRLKPLLEKSRFRERFEGHGRLSRYLAGIRCHLVTAEYPALVGSLAALENL